MLAGNEFLFKDKFINTINTYLIDYTHMVYNLVFVVFYCFY